MSDRATQTARAFAAAILLTGAVVSSSSAATLSHALPNVYASVRNPSFPPPPYGTVYGAGSNLESAPGLGQLPPVDAAENMEIHVYLSGEIGGYVRCANRNGCAPFSLQPSAALSLRLDGTSAGSASSSFYFPVLGGMHGGNDYGASDAGRFVDLNSHRFVTDPVMLHYDYAKMLGLTSSAAQASALHVGLQLLDPSFVTALYGLASNPFISQVDFDFATVTITNPKLNVHYVARSVTTNVPEPESLLLLSVGGALSCMAARRRASR